MGARREGGDHAFSMRGHSFDPAGYGTWLDAKNDARSYESTNRSVPSEQLVCVPPAYEDLKYRAYT